MLDKGRLIPNSLQLEKVIRECINTLTDGSELKIGRKKQAIGQLTGFCGWSFTPNTQC